MTSTETTETPAAAKKSAAKKAPATKKAAAKAPEANPAEDAIRDYLRFLENPASLVDTAAVEAAEAAIANVSDPIEKLKLIAAREAVATPDEVALRTGFITYAKDWATKTGISAKIFMNNMSVPVEVLKAAGFETSDLREVNGTKAKARVASGKRAKAVPVEDIQTYIRTTTGKFVLTDVIDGIGGSQATVRKALDDMIGAGELLKLGAKPGYSGRGRAPIEYVLASNHKPG